MAAAPRALPTIPLANVRTLVGPPPHSTPQFFALNGVVYDYQAMMDAFPELHVQLQSVGGKDATDYAIMNIAGTACSIMSALGAQIGETIAMLAPFARGVLPPGDGKRLPPPEGTAASPAAIGVGGNPGVSGAADDDLNPASPIGKAVAAMRTAASAVMQIARDTDPVVPIMEEVVRFCVDDWGMSAVDALGLARRLRKDGAESREPPLYHRWASRMREIESYAHEDRVASITKRQREWKPLLRAWEAMSAAVLQATALAGAKEDPTTWLRPATPTTWVPASMLDSTTAECTAVLPLHGSQLAAVVGNTIRLYDVAAGACLGVLEGHTQSITGITAMNDNKILSYSLGEAMRVWDVSTRTSVGVFDADNGNDTLATSVVVLPEADVVAMTKRKAPAIRIWKLSTRKFLDTFCVAHSSAALNILESNAPNSIISWGQDTLHLWDLAAKRPVATVNTGAYLQHVVATSNNRVCAVHMDEIIRVWDLASSSCVSMIDWSGCGIYYGFARGNVCTGSCSNPPPIASRQTTMLAYDAGSHTMVTGHSDGSVRVWTLTADHELQCVSMSSAGHSGSVKALSMFLERDATSSASFFVSAAADKVLRVWRPKKDDIYTV